MHQPSVHRPSVHRVVVLALPGVVPFELAIPARIFGNALTPSGEPLYEVLVCTVDGLPVRTNAGFTIAADHGPEILATADTVVVPPAAGVADIREQGRLPQPVADALARIRPGARTVSICTASYVLAAAGILDGRPATTHWEEAEDFQRRFPAVRVDAAVLFVDDGDVLTSAGVASGVDLCLHVVRRDHGSAVANQVARRSILPPLRDGGQAQYVERPVPIESPTGTAATRAWALTHLHRPLPLDELAAHASMSVRTFTRRFRDETGMAPGQWLTLQRVELARHLLESSALSVDRVATRAGFGSAGSLRQHLRAAIGVSPSTYRRKFQ